MPKKSPAPAPSIEQQVVALLRTLNAATSTHVLRGMAQHLQLTARMGAIADLPRARDSGSTTARRELIVLADLAGKLITHIVGLHSDALRAWEHVEPLDGRPPNRLHPLVMVSELRDLGEAALLAQERLADTPPHKGNRPRRQAREVTREACAYYARLTGKKKLGRVTDAYQPGHSPGPLEEFLAALFVILRVPASADGQLKRLFASPRRLE